MLFFSPEIIVMALWLGWCLDRLWGEPSRLHPLVGFGHLASWLELRQNPASAQKARKDSDSGHSHEVDSDKAGCSEVNSDAADAEDKCANRLLGLISWCLLVLPLPSVLFYFSAPVAVFDLFLPSDLSTEVSQAQAQGLWPILTWPILTQLILFLVLLAVNALCLYFALGARSLAEHLQWIYQPLQNGDLQQAREKVGWIVSRDTSDMDAHRVSRAAIESGLENGSDAIFAPLFWFALAGAPGVVLYRLANTLDAMWGYKTPRMLHFGWAAARLDDVLNYIPARLTAMVYCCCGSWHWGIRCWQYQGGQWESPNAGPVMAAGAGALKVILGGGDNYHGQWKERPALGVSRAPEANDIQRTVQLLLRSQWIWLCVLSGVAVIYWVLYL